ncbi:hypothetical protein C4E44_20570 [Pseudomonas sp. MWU12-2312b]|nr:hypothetical protein C4E44_20570 [Pseudomonas sp. MWU12-2312b]
MSQAKSSLHADQSPKDNVRICAHTIEKKESRKLSRFQALGHLCGWADGRVGDDSNAGNTIGVILGFGVEIDALGFDYYDPVHLLSAPNWKIRMYAAWCIIGSEERAVATNLNYDEFHNYWPSVEFCDSGWNDEVILWLSTLTPYGEPFEFRVAASVGRPPRPQLIMKP